VDLALFVFVLMAGLTIAAFCAGWIFHEQASRDRD
jgi:hypothetical protein